jgi:hypothetical protein
MRCVCVRERERESECVCVCAIGQQVFWRTAKEELVRVSPTQGRLLLHAHGRRCLMHEGTEVLKTQNPRTKP